MQEIGQEVTPSKTRNIGDINSIEKSPDRFNQRQSQLSPAVVAHLKLGQTVSSNPNKNAATFEFSGEPPNTQLAAIAKEQRLSDIPNLENQAADNSMENIRRMIEESERAETNPMSSGR